MTSADRGIAWALVAVAVVVNILGYVLNWYQQFAWFDEALHAFTIFTMALLLVTYLYGVVLTGARTQALLFVLMVICLGLAIGGLWEVAEWLYDRFAHGNAIKGKADTIIDLIMDTFGGIVAGLLALRQG
jgi:VanZ family protein